MKHPVLLPALAIALLIANSCKKDEVTPKIDLITLSGTWTGLSTINKKGTCTYTDSIATITQVWSVTSAGAVSIQESFSYNTFSSTTSWTGSVDQSLQLTITRSENTNCFGTVETKSFTLSGQIQKTPTGYNLDQKMDFSICPPNCLFDIHYVLWK
ncbi:MAG: hypothetical protein JNL40_07010 [Cyclobacteriaceae bacterium]|nr:hypothetical protein [Cyclobacteriaceae bacterium]